MLAKTMTAKQQLWLDRVKLADQHDGTIAEYAKAHDLRLKTLYQWKSKLVKLGFHQPDQNADSAFVQITPAVAGPQRLIPMCTTRLANGTRIEFSGELDNKSDCVDEDSESNTIVSSYKRRQGGRRKLPDHYPRIEVIHTLDDDDCHCDHCQGQLEPMGEKTSEQIE